MSTPLAQMSSVPVAPPKGKMHAERVPKETPHGTIYQHDGEASAQQTWPEQDNIFRQVEFATAAGKDCYSSLEETNRYLHAEFRDLMNTLFQKYKPTNHRFWANLKNAPTSVVTSEAFISDLYTRYQAAMHATRASVWFTPHLDTPRLRQRKAAIICDDDTIDGELTHHKQCENLFRYLGAKSPEPEESFGSLDVLKRVLDADTYAFCEKAWQLYCAGTGAWSIFEVLSDNWQSALADSLVPHYGDDLLKQQYFDEIATGHVEVLHMLETVSLTEDVLHRKPELLESTKKDAVEMAEWTFKLWDNFDELLQNHIHNSDPVGK